MLTQQILKKWLNYNSDTGIFTWKKKPNRRIKIDSVAGHHRPKNGYIVIRIDSKNYFAHRLSWLYVYGEWPKNEIDHINQNKGDNKIYNLRDIKHRYNTINISYRKNKSGVTGVHWCNTSNRWITRINLNKKLIYTKYYKKFIDAVKSRYNGEIEYGLNEYNKYSSAYKYLKENGGL